jgi:hypothetical protein
VRGDAARVPVTNVDGLPEAGFDLEAHVKQIERGYIAEPLKKGWREELQPAVTLFGPRRHDANCQSATYCQLIGCFSFS